MKTFWVKVNEGIIDWDSYDSTSHFGEEGWYPVNSEHPKNFLKFDSEKNKILIDRDLMQTTLEDEAKKAFSDAAHAEYDKEVDAMLGSKSKDLAMLEAIYALHVLLQDVIKESKVTLTQQGVYCQGVLLQMESLYWQPLMQKRAKMVSDLAGFQPNVELPPEEQDETPEEPVTEPSADPVIPTDEAGPAPSDEQSGATVQDGSAN